LKEKMGKIGTGHYPFIVSPFLKGGEGDFIISPFLKGGKGDFERKRGQVNYSFLSSPFEKRRLRGISVILIFCSSKFLL